jgi:hypothetical protein
MLSISSIKSVCRLPRACTGGAGCCSCLYQIISTLAELRPPTRQRQFAPPIPTIRGMTSDPPISAYRWWRPSRLSLAGYAGYQSALTDSLTSCWPLTAPHAPPRRRRSSLALLAPLPLAPVRSVRDCDIQRACLPLAGRPMLTPQPAGSLFGTLRGIASRARAFHGVCVGRRWLSGREPGATRYASVRRSDGGLDLRSQDSGIWFTSE